MPNISTVSHTNPIVASRDSTTTHAKTTALFLGVSGVLLPSFVC